MADKLPDRAADHLPLAIAHAERDAEPCGTAGAAVLMDRLWSIFPMPSVSADPVWNEIIGAYPADLVEEAIKGLIKSRAWEKDAPLPAHLTKFMQAEFDERKTYLRKLKAMQTRARIDAKDSETEAKRKHEAWLAKRAPAELETIAKVRARLENGESVKDLIDVGVNMMPLEPGEQRRQAAE